MRPTLSALLPGLLLGLAAAAAQASGGFYEINEACRSVGCFPGDNPATPTIEITDAAVQSGVTSFRLTGRLVNVTGAIPAISITAAGRSIELDLQGHEIYCETDTPCSASGGHGVRVLPAAFANVRIHNGSITRFHKGILAGDSVYLSADNLRINSSAEDGIEMRRGVVRNSSFVNNRYGIWARQSALIEGNVFSDQRSPAAQQPLFNSAGASLACSGNMVDTGNAVLNIGACVEIGPNLCGSQRCGLGGMQVLDPSLIDGHDK